MQQVSGAAIGTTFAPTYGCTFMDRFGSEFLKPWEFNPLVRYHYRDNVFFIWTHGWEKVESFSDDLNKHDPNIKSVDKFKFNNRRILFLDEEIKKS